MGILIVLTCSELLDVTAALCEHQRGRAQILAAEQQQSSGVSAATKAGGMMNDLGSADIRVGFILGGFFYSRFVQERGLKPRRTHTHTPTHTPTISGKPASLIWIHSRRICEWTREEEGRGRGETQRGQRSTEGKFGGDLGPGLIPGSLSTQARGSGTPL